MPELVTFGKHWQMMAALMLIILGLTSCDNVPEEQAVHDIEMEEEMEDKRGDHGMAAVVEEVAIEKQKGIAEDVAILGHDTMILQIGVPASMQLGDVYPKIAIRPEWQSVAGIDMVHVDSGEVQALVSEYTMNADHVYNLTIPGKTQKPGLYRIDIELKSAATEARFLDAFYFTVHEDFEATGDQALYLNEEGRLSYVPDFRGNRVPDYSMAGYGGGGKALPEVPVVITLSPEEGDATARIQEAINTVSNMPINEDGVRGAILLKKGVYEIYGRIDIWASGVVLRGEGQGDPKSLWLNPDYRYTLEELKASLADKDATVLISTQADTGRMIDVLGLNDVKLQASANSNILDHYVPVGANSFHAARPELFEVGDTIIVRRVGNAAWIHEIGMDQIKPAGDAWSQQYGTPTSQWEPFDLRYEYTITAIDGDRITIDGTIMNAIEERFGGGSIIKYKEQRSRNIGVENLRAISYWMPNEHGEDETRHFNQFILFNQVIDSWVRDVTVEHYFGYGAMEAGRRSKWITIQDSSTLIADRKVYEGPGYDSSGRIFHDTGVYTARYGFFFSGQGALVQRSYVLNSRRPYIFNSHVTGPNVFLNNDAEQTLAESEPHHRWSTGGLYDNVKDDINVMNRYHYGGAHGWAGANFTTWNTTGELIIQKPPTAQNWSFGHVGSFGKPPFEGEDGYRSSAGTHAAPQSLYLQQLKERLGAEALRQIGY